MTNQQTTEHREAAQSGTTFIRPAFDQTPALSWTAQLDAGIAARTMQLATAAPSAIANPPHSPDRPPSPAPPFAICVSLGKERLSCTHNVNGYAPCDYCVGKGYGPDECQIKERGKEDGAGVLDENSGWDEDDGEDEAGDSPPDESSDLVVSPEFGFMPLI
ncbi:uncharacterized protein PAC_06077 [Phialocephala subalpina]|uniref:Uncharacterized protein n=1 Tax=Phialocephala subalpina TaxID=576137 RepID=A0A1L7WTX2_9HELO|nr:uncharacterized protein PAC_06077 [Phialocephala subalpina]